MNEQTFEKLQYNVLKDRVKGYCVSSLGKNLIDAIRPSGNKKIVENRLKETSEARVLLDYSGSIPLQGIVNSAEIIEKVEKDMILNAEELSQVAAFLRGCRKIKMYMKDKEIYAPTLYSYSLGIEIFNGLEEKIEQAIRNNRVDDEASVELRKIRRHIMLTEGDIETKLNKFLKSSQNKPYLQEFFISKRQGRLTVPIKAAYKNKIDGTIIENSQKTVFIEPSSISKLSEELMRLKIEEEIEEYKVLSYLTGIIYEVLGELKRNSEVMAEYDMIFAKGKYSKRIDGISPKVNDYGKIHLVGGKHPLLEGKVIPLNLELGKSFRALIITGPNAGGKTLVLKTLGLLTLAMQSGFHIQAEKGTELSVFDKVFVDIGDDQSIENSLSTFSSHIKNLAAIMNQTNKSTLLLFDEIGSGTEPSEGAALAIAILEKIYGKGAVTIATTHYNEIKNFSSQHPDFENAAMQFNKDTLEPLYKLMIGHTGTSNALWIANKMGIEQSVLKKAEHYMESKSYDLEYVNPKSIRMRKEETHINHKDEYHFNKGDKVFLNEYNDYGIVYEGEDEFFNIEVFYKERIIKVNRKQLSLALRREELYPADYDLESLFISYRQRKLEKDIKRGSKKVLKKIKKYGIEELKKGK